MGVPMPGGDFMSSIERLVGNLVRLQWTDAEIHALLKGTLNARIDDLIKQARNERMEEVDRQDAGK